MHTFIECLPWFLGRLLGWNVCFVHQQVKLICMFFQLYKIIAVNGVRHNYTHFFVLVFFVTFKRGQCLLFAEPLALFAKIRNIWFLQRIQMSIMPVFLFWLTIVLCIQNVLCSMLASVIQEFLGSNLSVIGDVRVFTNFPLV